MATQHAIKIIGPDYKSCFAAGPNVFGRVTGEQIAAFDGGSLTLATLKADLIAQGAEGVFAAGPWPAFANGHGKTYMIGTTLTTRGYGMSAFEDDITGESWLGAGDEQGGEQDNSAYFVPSRFGGGASENRLTSRRMVQVSFDDATDLIDEPATGAPYGVLEYRLSGLYVVRELVPAANLLSYAFSTSIAAGSPGAGNVRLDNATEYDATTIRIDKTDADSNDQTAPLTDLTTPEGNLRLVNASDPTKYLVFAISSASFTSDYLTANVTIVDYSAFSPFGDGDAITVEVPPAIS